MYKCAEYVRHRRRIYTMKRIKTGFKKRITTGAIVLGLILVSVSAAFCIYWSKREVHKNAVIIMDAALVLWQWRHLSPSRCLL